MEEGIVNGRGGVIRNKERNERRREVLVGLKENGRKEGKEKDGKK